MAMRLAVLNGGRSAEREVSLRSGAQVQAALRGLGHDVIRRLTLALNKHIKRHEQLKPRPPRRATPFRAVKSTRERWRHLLVNVPAHEQTKIRQTFNRISFPLELPQPPPRERRPRPRIPWLPG